MSAEEKYADAITELLAQRAALEAQIASVDTALSALKALQAGIPIPAATSAGASTNTASAASSTGNGSNIRIELDTFHNLTTAQSIKKYLGMRGKKPATTQEIVDALKEGGQSNSDGTNFAVVVNNSLNRMAAADGEVSKVRKGIWGLKSWYSSKSSSD
jgi:hypothetical protein